MNITPNFSIGEFASRDTELIPVPVIENLIDLAHQLQVLRDALGQPVHINSGYRSPAHNAAVGGSPTSQHLLGKAADIWVKDYSPLQMYSIILRFMNEDHPRPVGRGSLSHRRLGL